MQPALGWRAADSKLEYYRLMAGRKKGFGRPPLTPKGIHGVWCLCENISPSQQHQRAAKPSHLHALTLSSSCPGLCPSAWEQKGTFAFLPAMGFCWLSFQCHSLAGDIREESAVPRALLVLPQAGSYTCHSGAQRVSAPGKRAGVTWTECSGSMGQSIPLSLCTE